MLERLSIETNEALSNIAVLRQKLDMDTAHHAEVLVEFNKEKNDVLDAVNSLHDGQRTLEKSLVLIQQDREQLADRIKEHLKNEIELSLKCSDFDKLKEEQNEREKALRKTSADQKDKEKNLNDFKQILEFKDADLKQAYIEARRKGVLVG